MTAAGGEIAHGSIVLRDGKIVAAGTVVPVPPDALRVDDTGKYVTPGAGGEGRSGKCRGGRG
jgi:imidazolonepropionase-like amidohydrolase